MPYGQTIQLASRRLACTPYLRNAACQRYACNHPGGHGTMNDSASTSINAQALIGTHDVLLVTLDTLRYDVARDALAAGRTPNLAAVLPGGCWEERHTPGNFTYAAHQA